MKNKYLKIIGSSLIVGAFLTVGCGHSKTNESSNSSSTTSSSSSSSSLDTPPDGYKKGSSCSDCDGTGSKSGGGVCAGCNGKGYHWKQK